MVIGPEDPLAAGMADYLRAKGLKVFGPSKDAARIEASKVFAKELMRHADVPTAEFRVFDHPDPAARVHRDPRLPRGGEGGRPGRRQGRDRLQGHGGGAAARPGGS